MPWSTKTVLHLPFFQHSNDDNTRPIFLHLRSSTLFITSTVCVAIFTDTFLYAVIVPVFPFALHSRIGIPEAAVQLWLSVLLAVYSAGLLVGALLSGIVADGVTCRRGPLLAGLDALVGSTVLLCLVTTTPLLIVGRALQGLAATVVWTVGLALLADTVPKDQVAVSIGYVSSMYSLGTLVAPLLGGVVYEKSGYYAVSAMCFGVIALDVMLRLAMVEKKAAAKWLGDGSDEVLSSASSSSSSLESDVERDAVITVVDALSSTGPGKDGARLGVSMPEDRPERKTLPILLLLKSRRVLAAFLGVFTISSFATGLDTALTLFVSRTFGWDSLAAGVLCLALLLPAFFAPVFGKHVDKHGPRWIGAFGLMFTVPFFVLLRLVDHDSTGQKVLLVALLVLIGFGYACAIVALLSEFTVVCDTKEKVNPGVFGPGGAYAQSYSIFNIS